uniref:Uncharacterized protein n=1 Tax=Acrobeloides nanus TaxID=290746 RepID=A0A914C970_9BILA
MFCMFYFSIVLLWHYALALSPNSPYINWTQEYDPNLAEFALEFASAAYALNPVPCLKRHGAELIQRVQIPCDYVKDE